MIKLNKYSIPYIIILFLIGFRRQLLPVFVFVILHEFVHYLTARKLGFSGFHIEILPFGASIKFRNLEEASYKEELIISISGPIMNFVLAVIFYAALRKYDCTELYNFFIINLSLGIFNLLPAFPLDGGRILRDILCKKFSYKKASKITVYLSIVLSIMLIMMYFIFLFCGADNPNLILISLFILFCSFKERRRIVYVIMEDIMKKKLKFIKNGVIENRTISIFYKKDLLFGLSMVDKNKYTMLTVLNENMKTMKTIYEEEIINALKEYGNITFEELIQIKKNNE
ncbi:M50 family metallopeptidase [Clostridium neuense]|uniref:M50 family metallopeptidase n=1 Tax=Clostridium neuense TaxID=1728934 RepID=A0ABW8TFL8_9CLOT